MRGEGKGRGAKERASPPHAAKWFLAPVPNLSPLPLHQKRASLTLHAAAGVFVVVFSILAELLAIKVWMGI